MHSTVDDLLLRWEEAQRQGQALTPEELCHDCPHLLDTVKQRLQALASLNRWVESTLPQEPSKTPAGASPSSVTVPGYEILGELGRGGMGVVYKARHLALKRLVALKMILAGGHAGEAAIARFRVEAEAIARLQHPNIVQVFEVGEADGHPFCALELVEGGSLAQRLQGQPLPPVEAARLVETLARAMHLAHSRNIVHRDLKPANILLAEIGDQRLEIRGKEERRLSNLQSPVSNFNPPGSSSNLQSPISNLYTPKIADFGLARQLDTESGQTQTGAVMGTPSYMAPEQASGQTQAVGPLADVYALGAILYECLTGRPPFKGPSVLETLEQVRSQDPVPPGRLQPKVPRDLETICLKCLRKEPAQRYASALEMAEDLRRFHAGEPILARPVGKIERTLKWIKRNRTTSGLLALVALTIVSAVYGILAAYREVLSEAVRTEKARTLATLREYRANVALGHYALNQGDIRTAEVALEQCSPELRGWEHRYLSNRVKKVLLQTLTTTGPELITSLAMHPTEKQVAGSLSSRIVVVWDFDTGKECKRFSAPAKTEPFLSLPMLVPLNHALYSATGKMLVGADTKEVFVWEESSGRLTKTIQAEGKITCLALSLNDRYLAIAQENTIDIWETATWSRQAQIKDRATAMTFSPDSTVLVGGSDLGYIGFFDVATGAKKRSITGVAFVIMKGEDPQLGHQGTVTCLRFADDGRTLFSGAVDGTVRAWDVSNGKRMGLFKVSPGKVQGLALLKNESRLATTSVDGLVKLWDTASEQLLGKVAYKRHVAFASDQAGHVIATSDGGSVMLWQTMAIAGSPRGVRLKERLPSSVLSPDGLAIALREAVNVCLYSTGRETVVWRVPVRWASRCRFSPDGKDLVVVSDAIRVIDVATGTTKTTTKPVSFPKGATMVHEVHNAAIAANGRYMASDGAALRIWAIPSGEQVHELVVAGSGKARILATGEEQEIRSYGLSGVYFSPDGNLVYSTAADGSIRAWETATGKEKQSWKTPETLVAVAPNGELVTSHNGKYKIWDSLGGNVENTFEHDGRCTCITFHPTEPRVATGGSDGKVVIWDRLSGEKLLTLEHGREEITDLVFSPDGKRLTSVDISGLVIVWE